jgi:hypothetical protein
MTTQELEMTVMFDDRSLAELYKHICLSIVRVTPSLAAKWLQSNQRNRPLSKRHWQFLASVMTAGDYILNGETIIFDSDNMLMDGQHRLHAVVESGVTIDALVVRGIDAQAFNTLDGGRARTTGEVLAMEGEVNSNALAGAVSQLVQFIDRGGVMYSSGSGASNVRKATPRLTERVLSVHPGLRESVAAMRTSPVYRNQQGYVLHYLFGIVDKQLADDFVSVLCNGSSDVGRPFNIIRESLIRTHLTTSLRCAFAGKCVKAFNAERSGDRPKMFKIGDREDFPTIDGLDYEWLACTLD